VAEKIALEKLLLAKTLLKREREGPGSHVEQATVSFGKSDWSVFGLPRGFACNL